MAHDVFVSYPSDDKPMADAVVNALENRGVRCWSAPRDVPAGADWAGAIMTAITSARMVVLVFSDSTNESEHILREVRAASDARIPIVPFRTTDADPSPSLQYYLGGKHWLDAITEPIEAHLDELGATVASLLGDKTDKTAPPPVRVDATSAGPAPSRWARVPFTAKLGGGLAVVLAIIIGVIVATTGSDDELPTDAESDSAQPDDASSDAAQPDDESASGIDNSEEQSESSVPDAARVEELLNGVDVTFVLANGMEGGTGPNFLCRIQDNDSGCEPVDEDNLEAQIAGDAAWTEVPTAEDVAAADFEGDGQLDWVFVGPTDLGNQEVNPHRVCRSTGGPCTDLLSKPLATISVDVGDLDEDGNVDVLLGGSVDVVEGVTGQAVGPEDSIPLHGCFNDGGGRFDCEPVGGLLTGTVSDIAIVDIDADGDLDAALGVDGPNQFCLGDGTGELECSAVEDEPSSTTAVVSGDFNENGRIDLAFANFGTPNRLCFNSVGGVEDDPSLTGVFIGFDCIDISSPDNPSSAVDAGDVNGDGHLDLLVGRYDASLAELPPDDDTNRTHLCLGDGTGAVECEPTPWESGHALGLVFHDINRDDNLDYLVLNPEYWPRPTAAIDGGPANVTMCVGAGDGTFECVPLGLQWTDARGWTVRPSFTGIAVVS